MCIDQLYPVLYWHIGGASQVGLATYIGGNNGFWGSALQGVEFVFA